VGHERGTKQVNFCAEPVKDSNCDCGNNYCAVCDPHWTNYEYDQLVNRQPQNGGPYTYAEGYEAHHIVCVSSVMSQLIGSKNKNVQRVINETTWCINRKINMKAMPLFGHTVKHYCSVGGSSWRYSPRTKGPPLFEDIPQHDWDHDGEDAYLREVDDAMAGIGADIQQAGHSFKGTNLEGALNDWSKDFRTKLRSRGIRNTGTHNSWLEARDDPSSEAWCKAFSMARASFVSIKGFPGIRDEWICRMQAAISGA
jgi:hypothetical protein